MNDNGDRAETRWCILRMAASRTLLVTNSLCQAGITAWTPSETIGRRRPRSKETIDIEVPIVPSFAFVAEGDIGALHDILVMPISPHPQFSIFRHAGRIPLITERQLASLGDEQLEHIDERAKLRERRERASRKAFRTPVPALGTKVRVSTTAFTGLVGEVEGAKSGAAIVNFGAGMSIVIEAWHLDPIALEAA